MRPRGRIYFVLELAARPAGRGYRMTPETAHQRDFMARVKANDVAIARLIGFEAKEIAEGRAVLTLAAGPQHANPMGTLHGRVLCDVPDGAQRFLVSFETVNHDRTFERRDD